MNTRRCGDSGLSGRICHAETTGETPGRGGSGGGSNGGSGGGSGEGSGGGNPPSGEQASVLSLTIDGNRAVAVGVSSQLTATAHMSDGTTSAVTSQAVWFDGQRRPRRPPSRASP